MWLRSETGRSRHEVLRNTLQILNKKARITNIIRGSVGKI
ncbi:Hypothetical protein ETEE_1159 [Edwardsiella anguillarum ET080813]|uniref:Uncharacterized protein n=1 Tax=Edwardsiella anguillarum ET080813 TaxID=667120 RepID=A0A076LHU0_9GAMM|nr:Hypothetical protein ETEE_1159 [Edwardsiella anguillarum ET080813]